MHACAMVDPAAANMRKVEILHDQAAFTLFMMPNEQGLSEQVCEYLNLWPKEEMTKLRR